MSDLGDLLDQLPVPDHGADFWTRLESELDTAAVLTAAAEPTTIDTAGATMGGAPGIEDPLARRRRARRWILAAAAVAAAVLAVVFGVGGFSDDTAPSDVVIDPTIPEPDNSIPAPVTPIGGATSDLVWSDAPPSPGYSQDGLESTTWVGSAFAAYDFDDTHTYALSEDGSEWTAFEAPFADPVGGLVGDAASLLAWGGPNYGSGTTPPVAFSPDGGATWEPITGLEPERPADRRFFVDTTILGGAVSGDTVIVAAGSPVTLDVDRALAEAGITRSDGSPAPGLAVWGHADPLDDHVAVCSGPDFLCESPERVTFAELGIDRGDLHPLAPRVLYRSAGGAPFEPVELDLGQFIDGYGEAQLEATPEIEDIPWLIRFGVVNGEFFIVLDSEAPGAEILTSADGVTWERNPLPGDASTVAATTTHLFATSDDGLIRSADAGRTWTEVPVPGAEFVQMNAGPGGVALMAYVPDPEPIRLAPFERNGFTVSGDGLDIVVTDPSGEVVARSGSFGDPPETRLTLETVTDGPAFMHLVDPATGEVLLELTGDEVVGLSGIRTEDDPAPQTIIAWSADGTEFEWLTPEDSFGYTGEYMMTAATLTVGDSVILASVELGYEGSAINLLDPFGGPPGPDDPTTRPLETAEVRFFVAEIP